MASDLLNVPTQLVAFRNKLYNPSFYVNQRSNASGHFGVAAYGHDGLCGGAAGGVYTSAVSGLDTTITITGGTLVMPIEPALIEGGTYTFSHDGTATARVWQGTIVSGTAVAYKTAPFTVMGLAANTQTNIEFTGGTILRPQFEPGSLATPFDRRPPAVTWELCKRYYDTSYQNTYVGATTTGGYETLSASMALLMLMGSIKYKAHMRVTPALTLYSYTNGTAGAVTYIGSGADVVVTAVYGNSADGFGNIALATALPANYGCYFHWTASAELG